MAAGLVIALTTLCFWEAIPRETLARRVFDAFFYPEYLVADKVTDWLSPHNRDAGIGYWLLVHPAYCILVGGLFGFGVAWLRRRTRERAKT
jgi:hypothetical protein